MQGNLQSAIIGSSLHQHSRAIFAQSDKQPNTHYNVGPKPASRAWCRLLGCCVEWASAFKRIAMERIIFAIDTIETARKKVSDWRSTDRLPVPLLMQLDQFRRLCERAAHASCVSCPSEYKLWVADFGPLFAHCNVVSYVAWQRFGGELIGGYVRDKRQGFQPHTWNELPCGVQVDLTSTQFVGGDGINLVVSPGEGNVVTKNAVEELRTRKSTRAFLRRLARVEALATPATA